MELWDWETNTSSFYAAGEDVFGYHLLSSAQVPLMVYPDEDGNWLLVDTQTGELRAQLGNQLTSAEFSPDDTLLACGTEQGTVQLWDVATGTLRTTLEGHTYLVLNVEFNVDGSLPVSGDIDGTVRL